MPGCRRSPNIKASSEIRKRFMELKDVNNNRVNYYNVALIDVMVQNTDGIEPVRFHRRTVQRP